MQLRLRDMAESIDDGSSKKKTSDDVKNSQGLKKLQRFLEDANEAENSVKEFVGKPEDRVEVLQGLARSCNTPASWCGLSVVPAPFLGKTE
jgi:hypothetical protein